MDPLSGRGGRTRVATVWLGGCSGCHMSFLDMDERLLDLLARVMPFDLVLEEMAPPLPDGLVLGWVVGTRLMLARDDERSVTAGLAAEEVRRYLAGEPALNRC